MIADWPPVVYALGAVTLISVAPLAVLPLLPHVDKTKSEAAQPLLLCFAAGGMLGDVFLHILPATLGGGHDHGHDHGHGHGHSHEHEHHHEHDDNALSYEWGGSFTTSADSYVWVSQPTGKASPYEWADPAMKIVFLPAADATEASLQALSGPGGTADLLLQQTCTPVESGDTITPTGGNCFSLNFGEQADFTATINTAVVSHLAIFAQHVPTEFERDTHYFLTSYPGGSDVEPVASVGISADHDHGHEHGHDHGHGHGHGDGDHGHDHSLEASAGSLAVLAGFLAFFLVEKLVRCGHAAPPHTRRASPRHPNLRTRSARVAGITMWATTTATGKATTTTMTMATRSPRPRLPRPCGRVGHPRCAVARRLPSRRRRRLRPPLQPRLHLQRWRRAAARGRSAVTSTSQPTLRTTSPTV